MQDVITGTESPIGRIVVSLVLAGTFEALSWGFSHMPNPANELFVALLSQLCSVATSTCALLCLLLAWAAVLIRVREERRTPRE